MCFIEIKQDLFHISNRIKNIDPDYYILYNIPKNRYEVHHKSQIFGTLAVVVPFKNLDVRTLEYVMKTRNKSDVLQEIEKSNTKLEKYQKDEQQNEIQYKLKEIYSYSTCSKNYEAEKSYKNKWN